MAFCTVINCIDGRVQLPVIKYLRARFDVKYVDSITEPGPVAILCQHRDHARAEWIKEKVTISINRHNSSTLAVVAHFDCAGNPVSQARQIEQLHRAVATLKDTFPGKEVIGLWVGEDWKVQEIC